MATTTTTPVPNASRKIIGLMAAAVIFTVAGLEIRGHATPTEEPTANNTVFNTKTNKYEPASVGLSSPAKVILGGTIATALLTGAAEAGNAGQQFGTGFATIAAVTAVFVNGGPVWSQLNQVFGGSGTGGTATSSTARTATTSPTTPTMETSR